MLRAWWARRTQALWAAVAGNSIGIRRNGRWEKDLPNAKIFNVRLNRGDAYMMQSGGGGGFGDPMERDPELVAEDVREGYVSPTVAHNVYGVVPRPPRVRPAPLLSSRME